VFENRDRSLWPNQFVNIHLLLEVKKNNTVVPSAAIQRGPQGTYVFVVKPDNTAEMRNVAISISQANLTAVSQGLKPGELVVTDGQDKLQPGTKVAVREPGAAGQNGGQSGGGRNGGRNGGGRNGGQASDGQTQ
jgi:membrane fusion protein, multidrug efflux system